MTRPTVLDMDLVVVPSKADVGMLGAWYRYKSGHRFAGEEPARDTSDVGAYSAMLSASPYPTAWEDVRKYVEGLEARLVAVAGPCSLGVGCEQYGVCYADAHGKPEECGKPSFECEALKDARRIADHDKKLWLAAEARVTVPSTAARFSSSSRTPIAIFLRSRSISSCFLDFPLSDGSTLYGSVMSTFSAIVSLP